MIDKQQDDNILKVKDLVKYFTVTSGIFSEEDSVKAVNGISFNVKRGETLGIVGESGCGKSTAGRTILKLLEPTEGKVIFNGKNIYEMTDEELRRLRRNMQIIFQDPFASLNPRMKVGELIKEPLRVHGIESKKERINKVKDIIEVVGLNESHLNKYPHEFSGGQRQRICIARALILNPKFIVCDEVVSALDVSIQSQIINLLKDLQDQFGLTYIFISHDLSVVKHISDRIAVMYLGEIVELASIDELFNNPVHPYTKALLSAIPVPDPEVNKERIILEGDVPSSRNMPSGCSFHTRCPYNEEICSLEKPKLKEKGNEHFVSCHLKCS
ncbi:ABC transporter ATP-binding protein [Acetohalobium arabaticum]|uniref:Oligopeptide/dipeptide ABC transporter, ATPase subunit n=1 Tax=Acetohalobium arabaticum (strain ATCC 49924 / DSM 5501 / Z-7288) TaxID=574087 RepID=D9QVB5_ACEAZ|nr:dipeptide ABC transporter ATP-binding protein [Acetohalobium arabaticum]ADL12174.1 oligopeptide/dipeptide ABC transporter, ATPase subunit [Acetohalobium arabaticum DSM 5501]